MEGTLLLQNFVKKRMKISFGLLEDQITNKEAKTLICFVTKMSLPPYDKMAVQTLFVI